MVLVCFQRVIIPPQFGMKAFALGTSVHLQTQHNINKFPYPILAGIPMRHGTCRACAGHVAPAACSSISAAAVACTAVANSCCAAGKASPEPSRVIPSSGSSAGAGQVLGSAWRISYKVILNIHITYPTIIKHNTFNLHKIISID